MNVNSDSHKDLYLPDIENLGLFENIKKTYVIGDLHGDVKIFLEFLKSIQIIKSYNNNIIDNYDIYKQYSQTSYKSKNIIKDIYKLFDENYFFNLCDDNFLIENFNNCCIIQLGDICDTHNIFNFYLEPNDLINNDIFIYIIISYIDNYLKKLNIKNFHFILLVGNHDFEHIINYIQPKNQTDINFLCLLGFEDWFHYILNYDEIFNIHICNNNKFIVPINKETRYDMIRYKFNFRHKLLKILNIYKNTYYIVSINNKTYYSHTLFFMNSIIEMLFFKDRLKVLEKNIISQLNNIYNKIVWIYNNKNKKGLIKKTSIYKLLNIKISDNDKNDFIELLTIDEMNKLIEIIRKSLNIRTISNFKNVNYLDFYNFDNYSIHFIGHEIVNNLIKLDISELYYYNIFDMINKPIFIYYSDIGLSKSINNIDIDNKPYYYEINFKDNIIIYGCNNENKLINNYKSKYYQKINNKIIDFNDNIKN